MREIGAPIRPLRIAAIYAVVATLWISLISLANDLILAASPDAASIVEIVKEWGFVLATAGLLFLILTRLRRRLATAQASLDQSRQQNEAESRRIERIARIGHWIWRPAPGSNDWAGGQSEYSEAAAAIFGVSPRELAISNRDYVDRFVHPDDRLRVARYFADPTHGQPGTALIEYRIVRPDGEIRTIYEGTEIVGDVAAGSGYWQGTAQDVTEIRRVEADLAVSEARFRDFAGVASQFQWELDENFRIVNYSGQPCELMPLDGGAIIGRTFRELTDVNAGISESDWAAFEKLVASHQPFQDFPYAARLASGHVEYRRASGRPIFDANGTFKGYRGVTRDETREVEARHRAQAAEELLSRAVESIADEFAIYDPDDRLVMMNSKFRESFAKFPAGDPTGKTFEELVRADIAFGYYPEAKGREEAFVAERVAAHRRGHVQIFRNSQGRWTQARDQVLPDGTTVAIRTDVTELAERDQALRESQANLVAAQRIARMGSWEYDLGDLNDFNANALRWSDEMYTIFGRDRSAGISNVEFLRLVPADDHAMIHDAMRRSVTEGIAYDVEHRAIKPDGSEIIVHDIGEVVRDQATGKPLKLVGTVQDVTAMKRTEDALRQAQKMEAVGQLTGGIAHDFNNLLMVVGGNLEMLAEGLAPDQRRLRRFATAALEAVMRGGQLTQRLLAFARRQKLRPEPTDLNRLIGNLVPLLHRTLGEQVTVETALASEMWLSLTDGSQVENAVLNLAVNARDAMPDGGRLIIRTENLHLGRVQAADTGGLPPGDYVRISVSDNGQGMPAEIRQRAFEPFFTTKEAGRGTGLGLSMVYGFVKQSGGHVAIESEVGRGTSVQILLPRVSAVAQGGEQRSPAGIPRGHERILVVEDEDLVRSTVRTMLESLGYDISEAAEGRQALAMYSAGPGYDLVLTDMVMPGGMSGWDLAQAIWRDRPQQRFLFSTGYSDNPIIRQANLDKRVQVLPKPYSKRVLATALRAAIDRPVR
jgi:PAS domain S-box-containing protein